MSGKQGKTIHFICGSGFNNYMFKEEILKTFQPALASDGKKRYEHPKKVKF